MIRDDELKFLVNQLESRGICIIIDSCYAGGFNDAPRISSFKSNIILPRWNKEHFTSDNFSKGFSEELKDDNRVIIMATEEDEVGWGSPEGHFFTEVLIEVFGEEFGDFNNNGFLSAEEAFNYTRFKVEGQHPTVYDGFDGELDIAVSDYMLDYLYDCESVSSWTTIDHTGGNGGDLWHLSDMDCTVNSPTHCWYFGNESSMRYNNNMNNSLVSPKIKLGKNPLLIFHQKGNMEYNDGINLEIISENRKLCSTFQIGYQDDWYRQKIRLHNSEEAIQIRFRAVSDESIPLNPFTGIGYFMIDELLIYSERMVR
jgi:hypothetical protein